MQWQKTWEICKLSAVLHLLLAVSTPVHSIKCYECDPEDDYICSPTELFGESVQCADDVTTCHKGFTVEANNEITRSCGDPRDEPDEGDECPMVHEIDGNDRKISCHCGTDLCNMACIGTEIQYWLCPVALMLSLLQHGTQ
ncbi:hypothetical protein TCAL_04957 [Tigriopus californicus]|uniref:Uncharacterized protein n=1 Tax=Tigriopus californicus TaxID=6832 RepID=A0A553PDI7_TIGCA|nr:uncharacterized protein LOC131892613 [Tigriopus californicus]TRY75726.1 hypothetical protein TCAL_04957 [Tigriopus californicus]